MPVPQLIRSTRERIASLIDTPARNWTQSARDILLSTLAATIAWWTATMLFGNHSPVFAGVAAIVCLAPGVANRQRQAIGMLIGVTLGIAAGDIARLLPIDASARIAVVTPIAMFAAASFGLNAVMVIQAGASAVIVVASVQADAGFERFGDAAIGGLIGLLFSQVLFTPDPVALLERAGTKFLSVVNGTTDSAEVRAAAVFLDDALASANASIRFTLRGQLHSRAIKDATIKWRGHLNDQLEPEQAVFVRKV